MHLQDNYDVIVIGAGPSGLLAAGRAAECGAKVLLIEKMKQAGRKLLITGNSRCNVTNTGSQADYFKNIFPNGRYLKHAFEVFFSADIVALLKKQGVKTVEEEYGRVFPESNDSADVLFALIKWTEKNNVSFLYQSQVIEILFKDTKLAGVIVKLADGDKNIYSEKVVLCTGGRSYPATGSMGDGYALAKKLGHKIIDVRPALVPLHTKGTLAEKLMGLSLQDVKAVVWVNGRKSTESKGEMLFAHYGLTGPLIQTISKFVVDSLNDKCKVDVCIDVKPDIDEQKLDEQLRKDLEANGKKQIENIFKMWMPAKLIPVFLELIGIDGKKEGHQMLAKERRNTALTMKKLSFEISGHRGYDEAIITAGGISTSEVDSKTMQSKIVKNLFFAGEVLDLDANTGGYNLQIAFSTGWLAGQSCVRKNE